MGSVESWYKAEGGYPWVVGFDTYVTNKPFEYGVAAYGYQTGVYGNAGSLGPGARRAGVVGTSRDEAGVRGTSLNSSGVRAVSFYGPGLYSLSGTNAGVIGVSREEATYNNPYASMPAGVRGTSHVYPGVIGISNEVGVIGFSSQGWGVLGHTNDPSGFAGIFQGNVFVQGTLTASVKNGV